jgi:hypothetical protein
MVKMMIKEIRDPAEVDYIANVDINHPSIRRLK